MTIVSHLHQVLAPAGVFEFLTEFERSGQSAVHEHELVSALGRAGVEDPAGVVGDLMATNILQRLGERLGLSTYGIRAVILLDALNGGDVRTAYQRLSNYDSALKMYELVREGMTGAFLENINARPGFSRLYVCSPWLGLNERQRGLLTHAIIQSERRGREPEVLVLTRPAEGGVVPGGAEPFVALGATVFLHPRLHTKLYIREPDQSGGYSMAIVGSQNLTRSRYLELGIRINADTAMVDQLIAYFWELCNASVEA